MDPQNSQNLGQDQAQAAQPVIPTPPTPPMPQDQGAQTATQPTPPTPIPQGDQGQALPPQEPEDTTPANFQLGAKLPPKLTIKVPAHNLQFEEEKFIRLLAGSISLSREEKKRIVEAIPKLRQAQVDELIRIFEEEKQKFAALSKKHVPQLEKLAEQHYNDWMDLETEYQQTAKKQEDDQKAEEIRKKLGL